ncbi:MAG: cardiolipin synthase B, partial [Streptomyces sp.]|nr:cardiolipin synthase B [Streptomyces sp.]
MPTPPADAPASDAALAAPEVRKQRLRRRLERLIGVAATEGNELVRLRNGDEIF